MKTILRIALIAISVMAIWVACFAQSGTRPTGQLPPNTPQPAPEMQGLTKALAGKWSTTYKFKPGGMVPEGGDGDGEEVWRTGPGGFTLMEEEHVRTPRREVSLFALHWWDKSTNSFRGMLCNNSGPATCNVDSYSNSSLKLDGKQFVIDMEFPQNGKKMMWHEVWSGITATSFTQTGDMGEVSGPLKRAVAIHGSKVAEVVESPFAGTWKSNHPVPTPGTNRTFMAVQSPMSPPGMATAVRIAPPRKMTSETKLGDKTLYLATLEVSEDGNTLTRTTRAPAKEDQKTVVTLKKQEYGRIQGSVSSTRNREHCPKEGTNG